MSQRNKSLVFFMGVSDEILNKPFVLSSLQDVEGALLLVSDRRWPASLMMLWSACEKMLRAAIFDSADDKNAITQQLKDTKSIDLQNQFKQMNNSLSSPLHDAGHKLRQLRNDIAHRGSSPEDDFKCIDAFFRGGISYYEACMQHTVGVKIKEAMGLEGKWFWEIYEKTRKGVCKFEKDSNEPELLNGMYYLQEATQKCLNIGNVHQLLHAVRGSANEYALYNDQNFLDKARHHQSAEVETIMREADLDPCPAAVSTREDKSGILQHDMSFSCPICDGDTHGMIGIKCKRVGEADRNEDWEFESLNAFCCLDDLCEISGEVYISPTFLGGFFEDVLTDNVKKFLGREAGDNPTYINLAYER
jgi:hypothetical protein